MTVGQNLPFYLLDSDPFSDFGDLELRSDDKDSLWETVSRGTGTMYDRPVPYEMYDRPE